MAKATAEKPAESGEAKKETTPRPGLPPKQEARLEAVAALFAGEGEEATQKLAVNFGRKLIKLELGMRNSPAPRGELTDEQVSAIYAAVGIERKVKAEKVETTDEPVAGEDVV